MSEFTKETVGEKYLDDLLVMVQLESVYPEVLWMAADNGRQWQ